MSEEARDIGEALSALLASADKLAELLQEEIEVHLGISDRLLELVAARQGAQRRETVFSSEPPEFEKGEPFVIEACDLQAGRVRVKVQGDARAATPAEGARLSRSDAVISPKGGFRCARRPVTG